MVIVGVANPDGLRFADVVDHASWCEEVDEALRRGGRPDLAEVFEGQARVARRCAELFAE